MEAIVKELDEIDGLKKRLGISSDAELAEAADISIHGVLKWRRMGRVPPIALDRIDKKFRLSQKTAPLNASEDRVSVPFLTETYASAGNGLINYDDAIDVMTFSADFLRGHLGIRQYRNLHIITAIGNSMEPLICSGELLFVLPLENENGAITSGGVYVLNYGGDTLVKRLSRNAQAKTLTLRSENPEYETIVIGAKEMVECRIIGRVVGHFDRI